MQNINDYWINKEERAKIAQKHTEIMSKKYTYEIRECIDETIVYSPTSKFEETKEEYNTKIILENLDSVSAIFKYVEYTDSITVLNFSSYKNPGGMFIKGSKAQEECLCHESFLYNVLKEFPKFYEWNSNRKNKALYLNRGLFSPNVIFIKNNNICKCNVITCAAPNKTAAYKYCNISNKENSEVLSNRIDFLLNIAAENKTKTLILGAYGCGVFGQSPIEVATLFKKYLDGKYKGCFETVVFAIPDGRDGNYKEFIKVLNK